MGSSLPTPSLLPKVSRDVLAACEQPVSCLSAVTASPGLSPPALCHLGTPGLVEAIPTAHLETFIPLYFEGIPGASLSWEGFPGRGQESYWPEHTSCVVRAVSLSARGVWKDTVVLGHTRSLLVPARSQPLLALNKDLALVVSRESPSKPFIFHLLTPSCPGDPAQWWPPRTFQTTSPPTGLLLELPSPGTRNFRGRAALLTAFAAGVAFLTQFSCLLCR